MSRFLVPVLLFSAASSSFGQEAGKWQDLFNGKDLTGWKANMRPVSFSVADGLMKAHGRRGMSHLFYVGEKTDGFEEVLGA